MKSYVNKPPGQVQRMFNYSHSVFIYLIYCALLLLYCLWNFLCLTDAQIRFDKYQSGTSGSFWWVLRVRSCGCGSRMSQWRKSGRKRRLSYGKSYWRRDTSSERDSVCWGGNVQRVLWGTTPQCGAGSERRTLYVVLKWVCVCRVNFARWICVEWSVKSQGEHIWESQIFLNVTYLMQFKFICQFHLDF